MKKSIKILTVVFTAVTVLTCFNGCGKKEVYSEDVTEETSTEIQSENEHDEITTEKKTVTEKETENTTENKTLKDSTPKTVTESKTAKEGNKTVTETKKANVKVQSFEYDTSQNLSSNTFKREFTVTYNYNGNGKSNTTAKASAVFNGWASTSAGSVSYTDAQNVNNLSSLQNGVVNLYAKWTDTSVILPTPTRTGYVFSGWYTAASGGTKAGNGGAGYKPNANITLYAHWTVATYKISYNANGGSNAPSAQTKTYGKSITLSSSKPKRTGYIFTKWNTNSNGKGNSYSSGATYSANANTVLYAQWTPITYKVIFYGNGATKGSTISMTMTYGVEQKLSSNGFTKTNYLFNGWNTKSNGTGTGYTNRQSVKNLTSTDNATVYLYAMWKVNAYTVKFDGNGATGGATADQSLIPNKSAALRANGFVRTGYLFKNWNLNAKGTGKSYSDKASVTNLTSGGGTVTLYAQWTCISYTVAFNGNGGTGTMSSLSMKYNIEKALTSNAFTKTGYVFSCWNTKADGTGKVYYNNATVKNLSAVNGSTVTLYAIWKPIEYNVMFYGSGETDGTMDIQKFVYDKAQQLNENAYKREFKVTFNYNGNGHSNTTQMVTSVFNGWSTTMAGSVAYKDKATVKNLTTTDGYTVRIFARWNDSSLILPSAERKGYRFLGWYSIPDGKDGYKAGNSGDSFKPLNDLTLYARWEKIQELILEPIIPEDSYRCSTEVITSYYFVNKGVYNCTKDDNIDVKYTVYNGSDIVWLTYTHKVVCPAGNKNLVYFKWKVPANIYSDGITIKAEITSGNSVLYTKTGKYNTFKESVSSTADTQYEISAPAGFNKTSSPPESSVTKNWSIWTYENGTFVKTNYGITINDSVPVITPDTSAGAKKTNGVWTMKSGYGYCISVDNSVKSVNGYTMPDDNSYTVPQYSKVLFPEFSYSSAMNKYRTLELISGKWIFRTNENYGRIHFTPLWYPDGNYSVTVIQSDMWTPVGMIKRTVNSDIIKISGSAYDDWYI